MRDTRTPWLAMLLAFGGALAIYCRGSAPGLLWGDAAEMQALAVLGGVAHPTGYPLFTLVGRVFAALGPGEPAFRATFMSAFFAAAGLSLLIAFLVRYGVRPLVAFAAAALYGSTFTFWSTALRAEVYSLAVFVALAALWRTFIALETGRHRDRLVAGLLLGLVLTAHLAFALPVALLGLILAWRALREGGGWPLRLASLLAVFLAGLSPYAYLLWATSTPHAIDYLKLVAEAQFPLGPVPADYRTPLQRIEWLILARNEYPPIPLVINAYSIAKNVSDSTFLFGWYDFGLAGLLLAFVGLARERRANPQRAWVLVGFGVASIAFSIVTSGYKILSVFLIPAYLIEAIFAAFGLQALAEAMARRWPRPAAAGVMLLLPVAAALLTHAARVHAYDHPIGPLKSVVMEEDDVIERRIVPSMAGLDEPRRFIRSALALTPDSALVIAEWRELMALTFAHAAEHQRPDLTVQAAGYPGLLDRVEDWQARHDLATRPIVILSPLEKMAKHVVRADTVVTATGQRMWIVRTPLDSLDVRRKQ